MSNLLSLAAGERPATPFASRASNRFVPRAIIAAVGAALAALAASGFAQELGIPQASDAASRAAQANATAKNGPVFLMPALTSGAPNTLSLLASNDGVTFTSLASEVWTPPAGALRDPSIVRHADGWYYLVYANGGTGFGLARSKNLRRWEFVRNVATGTGAAHAPEWLRDRDGALKVVVSLPKTGAHVVTPAADLGQWSAPVPTAGIGRWG